MFTILGVDITSWLSKPKSPPGPEHYHAYTTAFDRVVEAVDLHHVLKPLSRPEKAELGSAKRELEFGLLAWRTQQAVLATEKMERLLRSLSTEDRKNIIVSILIDHSGSMGGQKILMTAASLDIIQDYMLGAGINFEILGFTTSEWRGGRSRHAWSKAGNPANPGRLNDLLHIVYRDRSRFGVRTSENMLRPDLLKENVDGEAVEWAASRLRAASETRKILIVISDGAPVDDATLMFNDDEKYLSKHLRATVSRLLADGDISIGAIGLGYHVGYYYPNSRRVDNLRNVAAETMQLIQDMVVPKTGQPPAIDETANGAT